MLDMLAKHFSKHLRSIKANKEEH